MTQTPLSFDPVEAWAAAHDGSTFADMSNAFPTMTAGDLDIAARRVLRWRDGGYQVGRPAMGEE